MGPNIKVGPFRSRKRRTKFSNDVDDDDDVDVDEKNDEIVFVDVLE